MVNVESDVGKEPRDHHYARCVIQLTKIGMELAL